MIRARSTSVENFSKHQMCDVLKHRTQLSSRQKFFSVKKAPDDTLHIIIKSKYIFIEII